MILLDGLDEVASSERRRAVAAWVGRQVRDYPGNDFVITSRPYDFPASLVTHSSIMAIRPFTAEQVESNT